MVRDRPLILIVDDEEAVSAAHSKLLEELGYRSIMENDPHQALSILQEYKEIELVLLDIQMPQMMGPDLLKEIKIRYPHMGVIMCTVVNDVELAVQATKQGAYNYLLKPLQKERFGEVLKSYFENKPTGILDDDCCRSYITGCSQFAEIFRRVRSFAGADVTTLIEGETGTGKDLMAHLIHSLSPRSKKPFVSVNVAALSPHLFESELFGHRKGAFTGALTDRKGFFHEAAGGTLFLDEIGELGEEQQKKLLRILQTGQFCPVGATQEESLEARVVVATNRNLLNDVDNNRFRADLYYRLASHVISLPSLRERENDIELLAEYFFRKYSSQYGRVLSGFDDEAVQVLKRYTYPGNVRELEGIISSMVLLEQNTSLSIDSIPPHIKTSVTLDEDNGLEATRYQAIMNALASCNGNQTKAAEKLGISRPTLNRLLKKYQSKLQQQP